MIIDKAHEDPQYFNYPFKNDYFKRYHSDGRNFRLYERKFIDNGSPSEPPEQAGRALYERLQLAKLWSVEDVLQIL